nr:nonribosomal peptide synthetase 1 [Quercus suber]
MSDQLAMHLVGLGVGVESLVPICFEKSMWTVVAMLAIMKAGGAFMPVNLDHPLARRQVLVAGLHAPLMLVSMATAGICENMPLPVVHVSSSLLSTLPQPASSFRQAITPSNIAYTLFTSGSTGMPKGVVMEHRALSSSVRAHTPKFCIRPSSRVIQFSSYIFDACVLRIFSTLVAGGSVCIPSDSARLSNVTGFVGQAKVNWTMPAPSFVQSFSPADVSNLEVLVLGGEALTKDNLKVVELDNHDHLAPVGCIGELLIQGPGLAREYLNDEEKTKRCFIEPRSWLSPSPFARLYKSDDLVRYNDDGTIDYIGRKDLQIKIRGQRVELGEVEYHVKQHLGPRSGVSVQMLEGVTTAKSAALVVFTSMTTSITTSIDTQLRIGPIDDVDAVII